MHIYTAPAHGIEQCQYILAKQSHNNSPDKKQKIPIKSVAYLRVKSSIG